MKNDSAVVKTYRQAVQDAVDAGQWDAIAAAKANLALALFSEGDIASSLGLFDAVVTMADQENDLLTKARMIGKKGVVLLEDGQLEAAQQCFELVLAWSDQLHDDELKCDALSNIGLVLSALGDPGTGLVKQREALLIARGTDNKQTIMTHLGLQGHAYLQLANFQDAGKAYIEALQIARELANAGTEMGYLNNLGIIFINMDQHDNAIKAFAEVYELAMQNGDYRMALNAQKHLVKQAIATSNIDAVIRHARAALDLLDSHLEDSTEQAAFEDMLLLGLMSSEKYAEAKVELQWMIEKADADGDQLRLITAYGKLGDADYGLGELTASVQSYSRAVNLAVRHHDKPVEVQLIGRLAAVHADLGDLEKSNAFAQRAIASGSQIDDWETVGDQYFMLALNAQQVGQLEEAAKHCKDAVAVLQRSGANEKLNRANELLQSLQDE